MVKPLTSVLTEMIKNVQTEYGFSHSSFCIYQLRPSLFPINDELMLTVRWLTQPLCQLKI